MYEDIRHNFDFNRGERQKNSKDWQNA